MYALKQDFRLPVSTSSAKGYYLYPKDEYYMDYLVSKNDRLSKTLEIDLLLLANDGSVVRKVDSVVIEKEARETIFNPSEYGVYIDRKVQLERR